MRSLRTEKEIMANWEGDLSKPVVSVCCITFNHEPYIEDALEGFLIQETDFPFEIIIHDDASTDKTADIIREYVSAYPNIIKPILQTENQYSKFPNKPGMLALEACQGEYIALCEGDDYWLDKRKISIQKQFLDSNLDFVLTTVDAYSIDQDGNVLQNSRIGKNFKCKMSSDDLVYVKFHLPTMNLMFRRVGLPNFDEIRYVGNFDYFLVSTLGLHGMGFLHRDINPSVYRVHSEGVWSMASRSKQLDMMLKTQAIMYMFYEGNNHKEYSNFFWLRFIKLTFQKLTYLSILKHLGLKLVNQRRFLSYCKGKMIFLFKVYKK